MRRREMGGGDRMDDGGVEEQIKVQRRVTEKKGETVQLSSA